MTHDPFNHERDVELGAVLRAHLDAGDAAAFSARVRGALQAEAAAGPFDLLGRWMRPGLAAAAVVALLAGWWITLGPGVQVASAGTPVEVFAAGGGADVMLATAVEGR